MKHSPIPDELYWADHSSGRMQFEPLPLDLDKLLRAAPKLADALEDLVNELGQTADDVAREHGLQMRNRWLEAREVLAGLED